MKKGLKIFLVVLIALLAFVYTGLKGHSIATPYGVGSLIGAFIGAFVFPALLVFLVAGIYWLIKRKKMQGISNAILITAVVLMAMLTFAETQRPGDTNAGDTNAAIESISDAVEGRMSRGYDEEGFAVSDDVAISTELQFEGDMGQLDQFLRMVLERERQVQNQYVERLDAIGFDETFLVPERLAADPDLNQSMEILEQALVEVRLYAENFREMNDLVVNEAEQINFSSRQFHDDFMSGIKQARARNLPLQNRSLELEQEIIESMGGIVMALKATEDEWWVEDGQIYFVSDDDIDAYNNAIDAMNKVVDEQNAINNQLMSGRLEKIEELRNLTR